MLLQKSEKTFDVYTPPQTFSGKNFFKASIPKVSEYFPTSAPIINTPLTQNILAEYAY